MKTMIQMGTQNPLRVAEETAVLDHILKGRFFVGFACGYQARWVRTLGQQYKTFSRFYSAKAAGPCWSGYSARG